MTAFIFFVEAVIVVLIIMLCFNACSGSSSPITATKTIAAFGDSTTFGTPSYVAPYTGQRLQNPYPQKMSQLEGWQVSNRGINGMRESDLIAGGYDPELTGSSYPPLSAMSIPEDIVVLGFGIVTALRLGSPAQYEADMATIIDDLQSRGKLVVIKNPNQLLVGFNQQSPPAPYTFFVSAQMLEIIDNIRAINYKLGREKSVVVVPVESIDIVESVDLWDKIHPNQEYSDKIAELVNLYARRAAGQ